jgi:hypothetical protein
MLITAKRLGNRIGQERLVDTLKIRKRFYTLWADRCL